MAASAESARFCYRGRSLFSYGPSGLRRDLNAFLCRVFREVTRSAQPPNSQRRRVIVVMLLGFRAARLARLRFQDAAPLVHVCVRPRVRFSSLLRGQFRVFRSRQAHIGSVAVTAIPLSWPGSVSAFAAHPCHRTTLPCGTCLLSRPRPYLGARVRLRSSVCQGKSDEERHRTMLFNRSPPAVELPDLRGELGAGVAWLLWWQEADSGRRFVALDDRHPEHLQVSGVVGLLAVAASTSSAARVRARSVTHGRVGEDHGRMLFHRFRHERVELLRRRPPKHPPQRIDRQSDSRSHQRTERREEGSTIHGRHRLPVSTSYAESGRNSIHRPCRYKTGHVRAWQQQRHSPILNLRVLPLPPPPLLLHQPPDRLRNPPRLPSQPLLRRLRQPHEQPHRLLLRVDPRLRHCAYNMGPIPPYVKPQDSFRWDPFLARTLQ